MKQILAVLPLFVAITLFAQNPQSTDWSVKMQDPDVNYFDLVDEFNAAWEGVEITPGCGYKPFKRWEWLMSSRVSPDGRIMQGSDNIRQWEDINNYNASRSPAGNWMQLGPILDGITTRDDIPGIGRMNYVAFHPTDPNIIFGGAPAGGLWRSYDGGESWESNTDNLPTLGVSSIVFDPINPEIVYIGTGDRDAGDAPGMGVMKSIDGGITWEFANTGISDRTVGDILVHPTATNVIIAATSGGIYKSSNGGNTWNLQSTTNNFKQICFKPDDPNVVYATAQGRFYKSVNTGDSWDFINDGIQNGNRMVISVTAADPERVYVLSATTYEFKDFWMSVDAGSSFEEMSTGPNILGWSSDGSSGGGQAWYDLCMAANPANPDEIIVGGVRMKRSIDQGVTWEDLQQPILHVDQHWCSFSPHNGDLYLANDGGMYHFENNQVWKDITHGIVNSQIYKLGQSPHNPYKVLTGFQDNGTMEYLGAQWLRRGGGDGFECMYDPTDENWRYGSVYYGRIYRTSPDFYNQQICGDGTLEIDEQGAWVTPWTLSPWNENHMYAGLKNVWRTFNIKHPEKDSIVWERISNNLGGNNITNLNVLATSLASENILFCSEFGRKLFRTHNALADTVVWEDLSNNLPWFSTNVLDIECHPTDTATLYVSFNNNLWISTDFGENFENISGNLPGIPINSIVYDLNTDGGLYLGTDMGIYYKDNSMDDWIPFNDGFPTSARVTELEIYYGTSIQDSRIRAATYGRGTWESDLFDSETYYFPSVANLTANEGEEVYAATSVQLVFYKNLLPAAVDGLTIDDVWAENAEILSIEGGPDVYTLEVNPLSFGAFKLHVSDSVVTDSFELPNYESDTLELVMNAVPEPFGWEGPGGVGNAEDLSMWLRADRGTFDSFGGSEADQDEAPVGYWEDLSGNNAYAEQTVSEERPILRTGENGISGLPALEVDTLVGNYIIARDIEVGRDLSAFAMVTSRNPSWNEHGWVASAREANGYMLHNWRNDDELSGNIYDNNGGENMANDLDAGDVSQPHVYGMIFYDNGVKQYVSTTTDDQVNKRERNVERDDSDQIDIRFGRDQDDRWGQGKISEEILFTRKAFDTHRTLIHNYLGSRYIVDLLALDRFHIDDLYRHEVAGIGQEAYYDNHTDAKGLGIVRVSDPSDLDDGEYLLWGTDDEPLVWMGDEWPLLSPHVDRTWGFESTGSVGEVRIRVYDENEVLDIGDEIGLIICDAAQFYPGMQTEFIPLTWNGSEWEAQVSFEGIGSFTIGTEPSVGVGENSLSELSLYPNPVSSILRIENSDSKALLTIYNVLGQVVLQDQTSGSILEIDVSSWSEGVYQVVLEGENVLKGSFVKE